MGTVNYIRQPITVCNIAEVYLDISTGLPRIINQRYFRHLGGSIEPSATQSRTLVRAREGALTPRVQ